MLDPRALRRPDLREGPEVRLADGQCWVFPAPPEGETPEAAGFEPEYPALLVAVAESEGPADRRRAELILAIHLLGRNYRLGPHEYGRLLDFPAGSACLIEAQAAFGALAVEHLTHGFSEPEVIAAAESSPGPLARAWARLATLLGARPPARATPAATAQAGG